MRVRRQLRDDFDGSREGFGDRCTAEGAGEDADQGDADLDRGQEPRRLLGQLDSGGRAGVALVCPLAQAGLAGRHDGNLGHGQHAVEQEQQGD